MVYLWTQNYLKIRYQQTSYTTLVYITSGALAYKLTNLSAKSLDGSKVRVKCAFPVQVKGRQKAKGKKAAEVDDDDDEDDLFVSDEEEEPARPPKKKAAVTKKRKSGTIVLEDDDGEEDDDEDEGGADWSFNLRNDQPPPSKRRRAVNRDVEVIEIDSD